MSDAEGILSVDQVDSYRNNFLNGYIDWYNKDGGYYERLTTIYQCISVGCGLLATIVAALPTDNLFPNDYQATALVKWLIVSLTAIATISTQFLARYASVARLREQGRIRIQQIEQKARVKLAGVPMTNQARSKYLEDIADEIARVERLFGAGPKTDGT